MNYFFLLNDSPGVDVETEVEVPAVVVVEDEHHGVVILAVEEFLIGEMTVGRSFDHKKVGDEVKTRHCVFVARLDAVDFECRAVGRDES